MGTALAFFLFYEGSNLFFAYVCVSETHAPKSFDDLLMILEILRPKSEQFPTVQHGILERQEIISFEIVAWKSGCVKQEFLAQNLRR